MKYDKEFFTTHKDSHEALAKASNDFLYLDGTLLFASPNNLWAFVLHVEGNLDVDRIRSFGYQVIFALEPLDNFIPIKPLEFFISSAKVTFNYALV